MRPHVHRGGDLFVTAGTVLEIVVGGEGTTGYADGCGGGSCVFESAASCLTIELAAGGGAAFAQYSNGNAGIADNGTTGPAAGQGLFYGGGGGYTGAGLVPMAR